MTALQVVNLDLGDQKYFLQIQEIHKTVPVQFFSSTKNSAVVREYPLEKNFDLLVTYLNTFYSMLGAGGTGGAGFWYRAAISASISARGRPNCW